MANEFIAVTPRGLRVWDAIPDYHGVEVTVQDSSLATEDALRIYVRDDSLPACALLTVPQVTRLRDALDAWLRGLS